MPLSFYKKPALVVYVTCGDPDLATTRAVVLAAIEAGADVIELGVPFSDPVADGPVIQRASERALKHGTCLAQVLTLAAEVRQHAQSTGLVVFSYLNPILRMGREKFCRDARLKRIAESSRGFVYAVSRTGVTGARQKLAEDAQKLVRRLRRVTKLPIAVGFGISNAEQFAEVGKFADAVVVGSAIVETIEQNRGREAEAVGEFVERLVGGR